MTGVARSSWSTSSEPAKLERLLKEDLIAAGVLVEPVTPDLVIATHPHDDHIGGMAAFLKAHKGKVRELWDPGYWHTSGAFHSMMQEVEDQGIDYLQPSSGTSKWIGQVRLTALAPGISLRNRFDSYGIEINDSSIALKLEFPAARVIQRDDKRLPIDLPTRQTLILGADAQTSASSIPSAGRLPATRPGEDGRLRGFEERPRQRTARRPGSEGSSSRLQTRDQPGADGADVASAKRCFLRARTRQIQLPPLGCAGGHA